jgi:hypothetical protein
MNSMVNDRAATGQEWVAKPAAGHGAMIGAFYTIDLTHLLAVERGL